MVAAAAAFERHEHLTVEARPPLSRALFGVGAASVDKPACQTHEPLC